MSTKTKEELEKEKLAIEIRQLKEKWWKKPAYVAAFIPALVAIFTIGQILWTNHFKNQRTLLEIRTQKLEKEEQRLDKATQSLETQKINAEKELIKARKNLQNGLVTMKETLETERRKNQAELERLRARHAKQTSGLMKSQIQALIYAEDFNPQHASSELLINQLTQKKQSIIDLLTEETRAAEDQVLKANLLYILFKGTGDEKWFSALQEMARDNPAQYPEEFWDVFGMGDWGDAHQNVWEFLVGIMTAHSLSHSAHSAIFLGATVWHPYEKRLPVERFKNWNRYFDTIMLARDIALDKTLSTPSRSTGLDALEHFEPEAFLVVLAKVMADPQVSTKYHNLLMSEFHSLDWENNVEKKRLNQIIIDRNFPIKMSKNWQNWLRNNNDIVNLWVEDATLKGAREVYRRLLDDRRRAQQALTDAAKKIIETEQERPDKNIQGKVLTELTRLYERLDMRFPESIAMAKKIETFYPGKEYSGQMMDVLFPLKGVVLGKTTVNELSRLGEKAALTDDETGKPYRYYSVRGIEIWYGDSPFAQSVDITNYEELPVRWRLAGFDWDIPFNDWQQLFETLGWTMTVTEGPHEVPEGEKGSFRAEILVEEDDLRMQLNFDYGKGSLASSQHTLYEITVRIK